MNGSERSSGKIPEILAWGVLAFCLLSLFTFHVDGTAFTLIPDSTEYSLGCASILKEGRFGFRMNHLWFQSRYQPWFSATVLLPFAALGGGDPMWCIYGIFAAVVVCFLVLFLQGKRSGPLCGALACGILYASPDFRDLARMVMTEVPYTALLLLMMTLWSRITEKTQRTFPLLMLYGLLTAWAGSIRVSAFPLMILPAAVLLYRGWKNGKLLNKVLMLAAASLPSLAVILATLFRNKALFGGWFRTGYSYWCSVPYDCPGLVFQFSCIGNNLKNIADKPWTYAAILIILVPTLFLLVRIRKKKTGTLPDGFLPVMIFAWLHLGILLAMYLFYFFSDLARFLMPGTALFALPAALTAAELAKNSRRMKYLPVILLALCIFPAGYFVCTKKTEDPGPLVHWLICADKVLPDNAILCTSGNYILAEYYFADRHPERYVLPLFRFTEYANKVAVPVHPGKLDPPPKSAFDHFAPALLKHPASILPYPYTVSDDPSKFRQLLLTGRVFMTRYEYTIFVRKTLPSVPGFAGGELIHTPEGDFVRLLGK